MEDHDFGEGVRGIAAGGAKARAVDLGHYGGWVIANGF